MFEIYRIFVFHSRRVSGCGVRARGGSVTGVELNTCRGQTGQRAGGTRYVTLHMYSIGSPLL